MTKTLRTLELVGLFVVLPILYAQHLIPIFEFFFAHLIHPLSHVIADRPQF
jgi:hypothetical protein